MYKLRSIKQVYFAVETNLHEPCEWETIQQWNSLRLSLLNLH